MTVDAYEYNGDRARMEKLGLRTKDFKRDWTDLGMASVGEPAEGGEPATIKVEVMARKGEKGRDDLHWRFTMTRHAADGTQVIAMTTGSGTFREYFQTAEQWATRRLAFEVIQR